MTFKHITRFGNSGRLAVSQKGTFLILEMSTVVTGSSCSRVGRRRTVPPLGIPGPDDRVRIPGVPVGQGFHQLDILGMAPVLR